MIIFATYTALNINSQRPQVRVDQAAREFAGALSYAQNLATSGKVFRDELDSQGNPGVVDGIADAPNGYGVHLYSSVGDSTIFDRYHLYGDLYTGGIASKYDNASLEERVAPDVLIDARVRAQVATINLPLDIFFETGWATIHFWDNISNINELAAASLTVVFSDVADASIKRDVIINRVTSQIFVQ